MRQLDKEFLFDFVLTLIMWVLATPLAIVAHKAQAETIIETLSGIGGILLFVAGGIILVFNIIRRFTLMDK